MAVTCLPESWLDCSSWEGIFGMSSGGSDCLSPCGWRAHPVDFLFILDPAQFSPSASGPTHTTLQDNFVFILIHLQRLFSKSSHIPRLESGIINRPFRGTQFSICSQEV